jgi:hypothetical protein
MKLRKSWKEKLEDSKDLPRVTSIPARMIARWGKGTLVIPAPKEVDEMMRLVPRRKLTTINQIRVALAEKHRTTIACPMTTGIFAWIAANAAEEEMAARPKARVTPYWRTLKVGGALNEKYPGGVDRQMQQLEAEGHTIIKKGKDHVVADYEKKLVDFSIE